MTPADDLLAMKELKVRLRTDLHLQLHSRKILHGRPIQATVAEALDAYFAQLPGLR